MPAYQLRIQLRGVSPPVWRRILIDADVTIADLREAIQRSMGWEDAHLDQFIIRGRAYGVTKDGGINLGGGHLPLRAFGFQVHERFVYEYDFYSHWLHDVRVEKVVEYPGKHSLPRCVAGVGVCPPEDSGPPERFMQAFDDHSEFDFIEWLEDIHEEPDTVDLSEFRERLLAWRPWIVCRCGFDRKSANRRLQESEIES